MRRIASLLAVGMALAAPRPAEAGFGQTRLGQATRAVTRTVGKQVLVARAKGQIALDRLALKLEDSPRPAAAQALAATRKKLAPLSPLRLSGFVGTHLKRHPAVLGIYLALDVPTTVVRTAALPFMPASAAASTYALTSLPLDLAFLATAEYVARRREAAPGERVTLGSTLRGLRSEYAGWRARDDERRARVVRLLSAREDAP